MRRMRKGFALIVIASVLILAWMAFTARREAGFRAAITPLVRDLPQGTSRADVKKYLDSRGMQYQEVEWVSWRPTGWHAIAISLGPASGHLGCTWTAYVALEFASSGGSAEAEPMPSDPLTQIRIRKIGRDCW